MKPLSRYEANNIARTIVEMQRHKYWFADGLLDRLTAAACGRYPEQAADAMELVLLQELQVPREDDPHDGFDPRLVAKWTSATESVPAPGSDPKPVMFSNLSVRFWPEYYAKSTTCQDTDTKTP